MIEEHVSPDNRHLSYEEALAATRQLIDDALRGTPPVIRRYTAYLAGSAGKMLRAASVLICAQDEELHIPQDSIRLAAAIELVHLATLVHDDVIDQADIRRGRPTLRQAFNNKGAVICGDYLLSLSLRMVAALPDPERYINRRYADFISLLCLGEMNQLVHNNDFELTPLQYFRIINGKTAALFEASFLAGAVTGGLPEAECRKFGRLGHYVGMIFQLTDDCLDFEEDVATAGKNVQTDYEQNVITLPLVLAFQANPAFKAEVMAAGKQGLKLSRAVVNQQVLASRGLARTHDIASDYGAKAWRLLEKMEMPAAKRADLEKLLRKAMRQASGTRKRA
jgi:heptaprenyl diphosphate synthase